jgi:hypothetical protein
MIVANKKELAGKAMRTARYGDDDKFNNGQSDLDFFVKRREMTLMTEREREKQKV